MPPDRRCGDRMRRERGFTLLEVVIAFTTAGRYEEAVSRAKSHLAAIGRDGPLTATTTEGDDGGDGKDGGDYHWRIRIVPVATVNLTPGTANPFAPVLFRRPT